MKRFLSLLLLAGLFGCQPEPRPIIVVPPRPIIVHPRPEPKIVVPIVIR